MQSISLLLLIIDKTTMSLRRYFRPSTNMPMSSPTQLAPNVLREVNQAVIAALQREEEGSQHSQRVRKRKYTINVALGLAI